MSQWAPATDRAAVAAHRYPFLRKARAWIFDAALLIRESYVPLVWFLIIWVGSALYLVASGSASQGSSLQGLFTGHLDQLWAALYQVLKVMAFQNSDMLPSNPILVLLYFAIPLLAIVLLLPTVLKFGRLLFDKSERMPIWQVALASTYRNHIIVCGLGRVGWRVVSRLLDARFDVIVIEQDWNSQFIANALGKNVPVVLGDAREDLILRRAGLKSARAVLAVVDGDLIDIDIGLAARKLRPGIRVILRAYNEEMDRNLERSFGVNSAFSSSGLAAPTFAAATVRRGLDYVVPIAGTEYLLGIAKMTISTPLPPGTTLEKLEAERHVRVLGQLAGSRSVKTGTTLSVIGKLADIEATRAAWERSIEPRQPAQGELVIVCGLGKVGFRVVCWLLEYSTHPRVVVVTRLADSRPGFVRRVRELGVETIIEGDARDAEVLQRAGVEHAAALAAITSDDQVNLQMALEARELNPKIHIVLRVFSDALADNMTTLFGIHTTYSTSDLASATLAAAAAVEKIDRAFVADDELYGSQMVEISTDHSYVGRTLAALRAREGVLVVWHQRGQAQDRLPDLATTLAAGDRVMIVGPLSALEHVPDK
jgi:Trk K+ transport system NAD-binding subunit